jgi:hypothetical protein
MRVSRVSLVLIAAVLWIAPISAQTTQLSRCLHGENETQVQRQRRQDATDAADLINRILDRQRRDAAYPTWEMLAQLPAVASLRGMASPRGDLARKMQWGTDQPLPGWRIHYVAAQDAYAFSLTDIRDPCQLTFASNDTGVVIEGRPATQRPARVIPLDSTH